MWKLFCLPGRLIAELWYLWPKKSQTWASARRREHSFVHFFYSIVIYVIVAFFALGALSGDDSRIKRDIRDQVFASKSNIEPVGEEARVSPSTPESIESSPSEPTTEKITSEPVTPTTISSPDVQTVEQATEPIQPCSDKVADHCQQ